MIQDPETDFYEVRKAFEEYWQNHPSAAQEGETERPGWKQFKRWEHFMEPRVYPTGERIDPTRRIREYKRYKEENRGFRSSSGNWSYIGADDVPSSGGGAGRINTIAFDPSDHSIIYAGAPAGGLWKSTDGGTTWSSNTDDLPVLGVSDIIVDPVNTDVVYIGTGDGNGMDTYSIGVMKSTDGGQTWNVTGLDFNVQDGTVINSLVMHPNDNSILIAATDAGIYKTTDSGSNWTITSSGNFNDLEFKPGDPSIMYATNNGSFMRSTDTGENFTTISNGTPSSSNVIRMEIAVTPADKSYVYLIAGKSSDYGFEGFYRSTDSGLSFDLRASSPNLLGWADDGSDSGGQAWYDLSIAASPTDKDVVFTGGVNIWKTTDGGSNWDCNAHWYGGGGNPYVHADIHWLTFEPGSGSNLYSGTDGGVFHTADEGSSWSDLSDGLRIAQIYRLGQSANNGDLVMTGWQDNGSNLRTGPGGSNWTQVLGGDGMEALISHANDDVMYGEYYYGRIHKSTDGGASFSQIVGSNGSGVDERGAWVTPYIQNPKTANNLLVGKNQVYRSTDGGNSFSQVGNISGGSGKIKALAMGTSNTDYIYAAKQDRLWVSTDGSSFDDRSSGLPVSQAAITYIAVDPANPDRAWVTFSGYASGEKVYFTNDAGNSWSNYSSGLPNLPANTIVYEKDSDDGLYLGSDVGVYYRDSSMNEWKTFMDGMPNVIANELEINYAVDKIRAATYGRGLWESDLYTGSSLSADLDASSTQICKGDTVDFFDQSTGNPDEWEWTFEGAELLKDSVEDPNNITYDSTGTFDVTLVVSNNSTKDTLALKDYIEVSPVPELLLDHQDVTCHGNGDGSANANAINGTPEYRYYWSSLNDSGVTVSGLDPGTYPVTVTDSNGCSAQGSVSIKEPDPLSIDSIGVVQPSSCQDSNGSATVEALSGGNGGLRYSWSNGDSGTTADSLPAGSYMVEVTDSNGCKATKNFSISNPAAPDVTLTANSETCEGDCDGMATAVATGGTPPYSFNWDNGKSGDTISGLCAGDHSVTVKDANNCVSKKVTVTVGAGVPYPDPAIDPSDTVVYLAQTPSVDFTNNTTGASSYVWDFGTGDSSTAVEPVYTFDSVGVYTVVLTAFNSEGCPEKDSVDIRVKKSIGIEEQRPGASLTIHPNPTTGRVTVHFHKKLNTRGILIRNPIGQVIRERKTVAGKFVVDLSNEAKGLYTIHVITEDGVLVRKVSLIRQR